MFFDGNVDNVTRSATVNDWLCIVPAAKFCRMSISNSLFIVYLVGDQELEAGSFIGKWRDEWRTGGKPVLSE